jgi:hypothetical protein
MVSVFKAQERREPLELAAIALAMGWGLAFSRWKWNFRE